MMYAETIFEQINFNNKLNGYWIFLLCLIFAMLSPFHNSAENIHRDREDDGAVVLCRDIVQGLQVPQLWRKG